MRELTILHQDDVCVAIDKPAGLLVHRSQLDIHADQNAVDLLERQIGRRVFPVHRLDRPTSGVLLFGFDSEGVALLSREFEEHRVRKEYHAVVRGWPQEQATIDRPLQAMRNRRPGQRDEPDRPVREATTRFETLACCTAPWSVDPYPTSRYALLKVVPQTGRRHQIRRHLNGVAHPIVGDTRHGDHRHNKVFRSRLGIQRMLLAATRLELQPAGFEVPLAMTASPGEEFERALALLELPPISVT